MAGSEKYVPVVGDRVRATCGESVIVGEVIEADSDGGLYVEYVKDKVVYLAPPAWSFERIIEPIAFKPLAVARVAPELVRRSVDDAYSNDSLEIVRLQPDWWVQFGDADWEFSDGEMESFIRGGKAELVFEGVDPA